MLAKNSMSKSEAQSAYVKISACKETIICRAIIKIIEEITEYCIIKDYVVCTVKE